MTPAPSPIPPEDDIFCDAIELPRERRVPFIAERCGEDRRLLDAVMQLLRAHEDNPEFLDDGVGAYLTVDFTGTDRFERPIRLGSGGYGTVYEVWDRKEGRRVALKLPKNPEAEELLDFKREFRVLANFDHPNFVKLYELFEFGRHWFFTMELVTGSDIVAYARQSPERLRAAAAQLVTGLHHLHQECRVLHRDIKPANILVTENGCPKLLDFGLARELAGPSTHTQRLAGTPAYMAPETMTDGKLERSSDWYSVGAVLYAALTGSAPFRGSYFEILQAKRKGEIVPPRAVDAAAPEDLSDLCMALLACDPAARPTGAEVVERLASASKAVASSVPARAELVGRSTEMERLRQALRRRDVACIHVQGESGMGKSALCSALIEDATRSGVVLSGRCYENETLPYKALDPVVDSLTEYLKRLDANEAAAFLPLERQLQALARIFPTLLAVPAINQVRASFHGDLSLRDLQRQAIAALGEILSRISDKHPCVVFIDDLQWGDLDSVDAIAAILTAPNPPRALFLFSYRSEDLELEHLKRLRTIPFEVIEVKALSEQESARLAGQLIGDAGAYDDVVRETGGMPLFIHELAMYARSGLSTQGAISLQAMIERRVAQLPANTRLVLEVASVAARPLDIEVARQAAGIADPVWKHTLTGGERLIRWKQDKVEPFHDKIREAVFGGLSESRRRALFQALATALEADEADDPKVVYQYFLEAGDVVKAEEYIELAAERAETKMAFDLSVVLRERRLTIGRSTDEERSFQRERLAKAYALAGRGLAAAEMFQAAAQSAAPGRQQKLIRNAGEQFIRAGNFERGCALLTTLLQHVGYRLPAQRWQTIAMLLWNRCRIRFHQGRVWQGRPGGSSDMDEERLEVCRVTSLALALQDPLRSAELQSRHLLQALKLGEPYRIANSYAMEAGYVVARGGAAAYPAARALLDKVREFADQSKHPNRETIVESVGCKIAWLAGRWEEAADLGEKVNRRATEQYTRVAWEAYPSSIFWMCSLACMGKWRELMQGLPGLEAESEARGDLLEKASLPVATFAYVRWLLADNPREAAKELGAFQKLLETPGFVPHRFGVWYGLTDVALYTGDLAAAQRTITKGWKELESALVLRLQPVRILMLHLRARVACATACAATDKRARSERLNEARKHAGKIRKERTVWGDGAAALIEASVAEMEGRRGAALALLERAASDCESASMAHFAATARYCTGQLKGEPSDPPWFRAQQVANRERLTQMLCPGPWRP